VNELLIRPAEPGDTETLLAFIRELAEYERLAGEVVADAGALQRALFDAPSPAQAIIAEVDGAAAGFALFFSSFSTFLARSGLYLEDLYVRPTMRGRGIGKALLTEVARTAVERGCGRLEWSVLDWNAPAIAFYESLGAAALSQWTAYRLSGDALLRVAGGQKYGEG